MKTVKGKKVAVLASKGVSQADITNFVEAFTQLGGICEVIGVEEGTVRTWSEETEEWADSVEVDKTVLKTDAKSYDGLVIPGGVIHADRLRSSREILNFIDHFFAQDAPVVAINHGVQVLMTATDMAGYRLTAPASLESDIQNALGQWVDQEVMVDTNLVSSRDSSDVEPILSGLVKLFKERDRRSHLSIKAGVLAA